MIKCGKGCMPECQYFTTCGCISPFNCPYKIETGYINSATSTLHNEVIEDYKRRAEVAEKAFLILWNECKEKLGWNIDCTMWYAKQAEKELAEEKKYDRKRKNN